MQTDEIICKHKDGKVCRYYEKTKTPKIGICLLKGKVTFFCHYSEKIIGKYNGDSEIETN